MLNDHQKRLEYSQSGTLQNEIPDFVSKLSISDNPHFELNGTVNKQNCSFRGIENIRKRLYTRVRSVWCGVTTQLMARPYFFKDDRGNVVTVNGARYRQMIEQFLMPDIN